MEKVSQKDIDWLLNLNQDQINDRSSASGSVKEKKNRSLLSKILLWVFLIPVLVFLPFFILIRTSVYLNLNYSLGGWTSLSCGILAAIILLTIYLFLLFRRTKNKKRLLKFSFYGFGSLVVTFCLYGVMYLSSVHAKSDQVQRVYRSLHPVLRVAVATTTLADGDLVITDIKRPPEDYSAMGLPINQSSLHFTQENGYVHAIDLRTIGRSEFRNLLLQQSLEILGFGTIRHVGTADHLHISLPPPE
ncbi:hypothetical protein [Gracilimonas sp.]|uniref:hypothetical protein n=1 Tax=Gracilimonas sp. TaxID=1974203 RepID=UPI002871FC69|nr:hypothetical protein [Gracilimonas sp.]